MRAAAILRVVPLFAGMVLYGSLAFSQTMEIEYAFGPKNKCGGVSPAIKIVNAPPGTEKIKIEMKDLDVPSFKHWNNTFEYEGSVPEGKGVNYYGPCPPSGKHTYLLTVTALDAHGKVLGSAKRQSEESR